MLSNKDLASFAPVVLRVGLSALFLWFGLSQMTAPSDWLAWVPAWPTNLTGLSAGAIVLLNGAFEVVFGALLFAGYWTRWVALLLAIHMYFLAYEFGYNDIGVRDFALATSTLALALFGPDKYTLDARFAAKTAEPSNPAVSV